MIRFLILFNILFAGLNCIINQILFYKNLKLTFPSISFATHPFVLNKGSRTTIGRRAMIGKRCELIVIGELNIGMNFCMNKYSRIVSHKKIEIGDNVTIAQFVSILDHDHNYIIENDKLILDGYRSIPIKIGNNVWIGDKVTICKGVTIGDNVIIGANSVVTKNIEDNCIVGGIPCRILKRL